MSDTKCEGPSVFPCMFKSDVEMNLVLLFYKVYILSLRALERKTRLNIQCMYTCITENQAWKLF